MAKGSYNIQKGSWGVEAGGSRGSKAKPNADPFYSSLFLAITVLTVMSLFIIATTHLLKSSPKEEESMVYMARMTGQKMSENDRNAGKNERLTMEREELEASVTTTAETTHFDAYTPNSTSATTEKASTSNIPALKDDQKKTHQLSENSTTSGNFANENTESSTFDAALLTTGNEWETIQTSNHTSSSEDNVSTITTSSSLTTTRIVKSTTQVENEDESSIINFSSQEVPVEGVSPSQGDSIRSNTTTLPTDAEESVHASEFPVYDTTRQELLLKNNSKQEQHRTDSDDILQTRDYSVQESGSLEESSSPSTTTVSHHTHYPDNREVGIHISGAKDTTKAQQYLWESENKTIIEKETTYSILHTTHEPYFTQVNDTYGKDTKHSNSKESPTTVSLEVKNDSEAAAEESPSSEHSKTSLLPLQSYSSSEIDSTTTTNNPTVTMTLVNTPNQAATEATTTEKITTERIITFEDLSQNYPDPSATKYPEEDINYMTTENTSSTEAAVDVFPSVDNSGDNKTVSLPSQSNSSFDIGSIDTLKDQNITTDSSYTTTQITTVVATAEKITTERIITFEDLSQNYPDPSATKYPEEDINYMTTENTSSTEAAVDVFPSVDNSGDNKTVSLPSQSNSSFDIGSIDTLKDQNITTDSSYTTTQITTVVATAEKITTERIITYEDLSQNHPDSSATKYPEEDINSMTNENTSSTGAAVDVSHSVDQSDHDKTGSLPTQSNSSSDFNSKDKIKPPTLTTISNRLPSETTTEANTIWTTTTRIVLVDVDQAENPRNSSDFTKFPETINESLTNKNISYSKASTEGFPLVDDSENKNKLALLPSNAYSETDSIGETKSATKSTESSIQFNSTLETNSIHTTDIPAVTKQLVDLMTETNTEAPAALPSTTQIVLVGEGLAENPRSSTGTLKSHHTTTTKPSLNLPQPKQSYIPPSEADSYEDYED
ncbi:serine-rich adhesin for platelets-like [Hetaerina americana]|uniref:serine-rich adhesin for platelets-like n=1 Tax=Hetaerina americana TaxID=62018 RepID=UPI003A7F5D32